MLIMVAHGEAQMEVDKTLMGQLDSPLTERGQEQAKDCAETLEAYKFDFVVSSDDQACAETAQAILQGNHHRATLVETDALRGRSGGTYEGLPYADIRKMLSPRKYRLWERDVFESPELGESYADIAERVLPFVKNEIVPRMARNDTVLMVASPEVIRVIISFLRQSDEQEIVKTKVEHALPCFYYGNPPSQRP